MQFLEQHWESLLHSLPKRLQSLAQATPGTEAKAAPRRAPPIHLIALPLERVPLASPLASSSRESSTSPCGRPWCERSLLVRSSVGIACLLLMWAELSIPASLFGGPATSSQLCRRPLGFAPPPHDGFALLASAHTDAHTL